MDCERKLEIFVQAVLFLRMDVVLVRLASVTVVLCSSSFMSCAPYVNDGSGSGY